MPDDTSAGARASEKEWADSERGYSLYAASQDSTLQAILLILQRLMGGDSPMTKELGMLANAFSGLGNGGASSHAQIAAAVRRYGVLGSSSDGRTGTIGGADMVSGAAASALHKSMMGRFLDPYSKQTTGAARGLSQGELGQAAALALRNGAGMSGTAFSQGADGTISVGGAPGSSHAGALRQMETEVGKAAGLLRTIKSFLGSPALQNLDTTLQDLFGGSVQAMGGTGRAQAKLQQMMTISKLHNPENPMKMFNMIHDGVGRSVAQAFGGPGMSPEEARFRYRAAGSMVQNDIASRGLAANSHYYGAEAGKDPSRYLGGPMLEDRMQAQAELVGGIARQEEERMVGSYVARTQGGASAQEFDRLSNNLTRTGGDPIRAAKARADLAEYVYRRSGRTIGEHDLQGISEMPGVQADMAQRALEQMNTWGAGRVQDDLVENSKLFGVSGEVAGTAGFGFANLSSGQQAHLKGLLRDGNRGDISNYIDKDLRGNLSKAGVNVDNFASQMYGMTNEAGISSLSMMGAAAARNKHFVSTGALQEEQKNQLAKRMQELTGTEASPDVLRDLISGIAGQREFSDGQVLRSMQGGDLTLASGWSGLVENTPDNQAALHALGINANLSTEEGQSAAGSALYARGGRLESVQRAALSIEGDKKSNKAFAHLDLDAAGNYANTAANREQLQRTLGSGVDLSDAAGLADVKKRLGEMGVTSTPYEAHQIRTSSGDGEKRGLKTGLYDEKGLRDTPGNRELLYSLIGDAAYSIDLSQPAGQQQALGILQEHGALTLEGVGKDGTGNFLWANTDDLDAQRGAMSTQAQRAYLEQVRGITDSKAEIDWKGGTPEQLAEKVKAMAEGADPDKLSGKIADLAEKAGSTNTKEASKAKADLDIIGTVGAGMSEENRERLLNDLDTKREAKQKEIQDIIDNKDSYKEPEKGGGQGNENLTADAQKKLSQGYKRKAALDSAFKVMSGGKESNTVGSMIVTLLKVMGIDPDSKPLPP